MSLFFLLTRIDSVNIEQLGTFKYLGNKVMYIHKDKQRIMLTMNFS